MSVLYVCVCMCYMDHFLDLVILWSFIDMSSWALWTSGLGVETDSEGEKETKFEPEELFFARRHTKGKTKYYAKLNRNEVVQATKEAAKRLGLNPKHFSSHSWKIASITDLVAQGEADATVRRLGDHAVGSASTFIYQRDSGRESRPLVLASSGKGLTVADTHNCCPLEETRFDDLKAKWRGTPMVHIENDVTSMESFESDDSDDIDDEG